MEVIFFLVPIAIILIGFIVWALWWAIQAGQFEDLLRSIPVGWSDEN